jgi:predicted regulator of Ras-like GTPase activity (Roadblock/LC7/MglB family)
MTSMSASVPPGRGANRPGIATALATLKDVAGVNGSFVFFNDGRLVAREIHAMFDDDALGEAAERLTRLHDTFAAVGDQLDLAVIRFQDHKLYLKVLPGGMLCIVADSVVNMPALRMAANLVGRRIAPDMERAEALPPQGRQGTESGALPATVQGVSRPRGQVIAPGTRRFRGRAVE